jgi:hypothetical protein
MKIHMVLLSFLSLSVSTVFAGDIESLEVDATTTLIDSKERARQKGDAEEESTNDDRGFDPCKLNPNLAVCTNK